MFRSLCYAPPGLVGPVDRLLQRRTIKWRFNDGSLAVWLSSMVQTDWVMVWTLFDETLNSGFPINRRKTTATESNVGVGGWSLQPSSPFWRASRLLECLSVLEEVKWANLPVDTGCEIPFFSCVLPLSGNTGWQEEEGFLVVLLTSYLRCCSPFWQTGWKSSGRKSLLWKKSRKSLKIIATVTVNIRRIEAVMCFLSVISPWLLFLKRLLVDLQDCWYVIRVFKELD